jgi:two-component system, NarL family, response regulator DegU
LWYEPFQVFADDRWFLLWYTCATNVLSISMTQTQGTVMAQPIRVLIADDSARTREGLRVLFVAWPEITVVGEAADGQEAVRLVAECRPEVVLMDLHMPVLDGVQATQLIKQQWPAVTVIVHTIYVVEQSAALAAGADAFIIKGSAPERLLAAIGVGAEKLHERR